MKNNPTPAGQFLAAVASGEPVLAALGLTAADFEQASFADVMEDADDVGAGVTAVGSLAGTTFFGHFKHLVAKEHSDGSVRYLFTGMVHDAAAITSLAQQLSQTFGQGYHDEQQHLPFTRTDVLAHLAGAAGQLGSEMLVETWLGKQVTATLSYGPVVRHGLLFSVLQQPTPVADVAVRNRGTIADLLRLNLHTVLLQPALREEKVLKDGQLHSMLYYFQLAKLELGVFDLAQVRIFGPDRAFGAELPVNLTLTCSQPTDDRAAVRLIEQVSRLYGPDYLGAAELTGNEVDQLRRGQWDGRMWNMSEQHRPWVPDGSDPMAYFLRLGMDQRGGLTLTIVGYNRLLELFTVA